MSLDFLFEGKPPKSVTTFGSSTESMPAWYSDYTQGLLNRANAVAAEPYQPYTGPRIAGMSQDQQSAFDMIRNSAGAWTPSLNTASNLVSGVGSMNPLATAQPRLTEAASGVRSALGMQSGLGAANPYLQAASGTFPGAVDDYMSPYITNVTDRAAQLTNRALNENLLPAVSNMFGSAGQDARSAEMRRTVDRGVRDLAEGLQAQNLAALDQGYQVAGALHGQDMNRLGALGSTAGQLAQGDRGMTGNLAALMKDIGATEGALADRAGVLGLGAAELMAGLAGQRQDMTMRDAAALEASGATQQQQVQRNLDLAYEDFLAQREHPRNMVDWMSNIVRGIPTDRTVTTSNTGPADVYSPSPLAQVASVMTALGGLRKNARGGPVRYARGGATRRSGALRKFGGY